MPQRRRRRKKLVQVIDRRSARGVFYLRYTDPETNKVREDATKCTRKGEAEREAEKLTRRLEDGELLDEIGWHTFRARYETEHLGTQKAKSRAAWKTAANHFEAMLKPRLITDVDASMVSQFKAKLTARKLSINSIASYLTEIKAALNWAGTVFRGYKPPQIAIPKTPKKMRGRPITKEEMERMLAATAKVVGKKYAKSWRLAIRGLWLSGLRVGEIRHFYWDREDKLHPFNLDKRRPMFRVFAEDEKGNQDRLMPMAPDFATWLRQVPKDRRRGRVFRPRLSRGPVRCTDTISKTIAAIGKEAGVVTEVLRGGKKRFAAAHDLRRSFGARWAPRVPQIVLMAMMRHESFETTRIYYLGQNADRMAAELWRAFREKGEQNGERPVDGDAPQKATGNARTNCQRP